MMARYAFIAALLACAGTRATAQEPAPPKEMPAAESLEPAVDTSAAKPVEAKQPVETRTAPAARAKSAKAQDRIELDTTQITGNRELPKVLYIVPWKRSDLGDLLGKPVNSLLDEVLAPVDRDVFKRETRYYSALQPDQPDETPTSPPAAAPGKPE